MQENHKCKTYDEDEDEDKDEDDDDHDVNCKAAKKTFEQQEKTCFDKYLNVYIYTYININYDIINH